MSEAKMGQEQPRCIITTYVIDDFTPACRRYTIWNQPTVVERRSYFGVRATIRPKGCLG
jgi:hypothetical protein